MMSTEDKRPRTEEGKKKWKKIDSDKGAFQQTGNDLIYNAMHTPLNDANHTFEQDEAMKIETNDNQSLILSLGNQGQLENQVNFLDPKEIINEYAD